MADTETIKKYKIQQKTGTDTFTTLHPETQADIVTNTEIDDAKGTKLYDAGNVQDTLTAIARNVQAATAGSVTDVQVKDSGDAESVVVSGIATVDISGKQDKISATNKISADYIVDGTTNHTFTAADDTKLAGIQEGATKVEASATNGKIKINGTETTVYTEPTYAIAKAETAETGYSATYKFTKDGTQVGASINIPKDLVVESGSVKTCTEAGVPVEGYKVGDKYIDLVLANKDNSHIYILVSDLVDTYTAGTGITIAGNKISVTANTYASYATQTTVGDSTSGLVKDVTDLKAVGATKVEASATNGKIKINDTETTVYTLPSDIKAITVNATAGVSDGTNTYKYDDSGVVKSVNGVSPTSNAVTIDASKVNMDETAATKVTVKSAVETIQGYFTDAAQASVYSVVQTNAHGVVTAGGKLIEVGAEADASLVTGGILFKEITE